MHNSKRKFTIILTVIICCVFLAAGCRKDDKEQRARLENALATSIEAMEQAKAAQARIDELELRLANILKQMEDQDVEARKAADAARQSAIMSRDAAERAETAALKCEKIFERSLRK